MLCPDHLVCSTLKGGFIISAILCVLTSANVEAACPAHKEVLCPCGQTGNAFVTLCDSGKDGPCEQFKFCETCSEESRSCATCPQGQSGRYCTEDRENNWNDITNHDEDIGPGLRRYRPKRGVSCPDLQSPKLGSIRCWFSRNEKECTGRCLPGHSFKNREDEEIILKCMRGRWVPLSSYPPCISEGHCDLEMTGAGSFNCTTGSRGTFCDIRCTSHRWVSSRYFCYPGHSWEPSLPHCIRKKGGEIQKFDCKCQNGGTCDPHTERCTCLEHFEGRFCERHVHVPKSYCSDPGNIANGEKMNSEGRTPNRNQLYEEGFSVVYFCRAGFALVGQSLLTCQSSGSWSAEIPVCQRIQVPTSTSTTTTVKPIPKIFCPDPGFIKNGDRWTSGGRASSRGDIFEKGKSVVFSCREGFALEGLSILTCLPSRQWSNILPQCKQINRPPPPPVVTEDYGAVAYCPDPGSDPNAERTENPWLDAKRRRPTSQEDEEFPQGFRLQYECKKGYVLQGDNAILCLFTGMWNADIPTCNVESKTSDTLVYCPDPGLIENGKRIVVLSLNQRKKLEAMVEEVDAEYPEGAKLQYFCLKGFRLEGDSIIRCKSDGEWSDIPPDCL